MRSKSLVCWESEQSSKPLKQPNLLSKPLHWSKPLKNKSQKVSFPVSSVKILGESQDTPKVIPLEEDSVLLEKPKITDLNQNNLKKELTVYDQMIVLSLIYHLQKSQVKDEILQEQVSAYLRSIMDTSKNWLVYSMCLFVKSLNEFDRMKTKERSLLQLQTLIDQFNDKLPKPYERLKYYYSLYYPSYLELQKVTFKENSHDSFRLWLKNTWNSVWS